MAKQPKLMHETTTLDARVENEIFNCPTTFIFFPSKCHSDATLIIHHMVKKGFTFNCHYSGNMFLCSILYELPNGEFIDESTSNTTSMALAITEASLLAMEKYRIYNNNRISDLVDAQRHESFSDELEF